LTSQRAQRTFAIPPAGWLALALAYFVTVTLAHLPVSLWLVRRRVGPWGDFRIADLLPAVLVVCAIVLAVWVARSILRSGSPGRAALAWLLLCAAVFAADRLLTFSVPEYAHYPQYALLALLFARALDPTRTRCIPGRVIFWTTLCGGLDEVAQYLWTTTGYSEYLDFNDILVNLLAAVAGTLLYYARRTRGARQTPHAPRAELMTFAVIATVIALALGAGRLAVTPAAGVTVPPGGVVATDDGRYRLYLQRHHPGVYASSHDEGPYRGRYWILDPLSGLLLSLAAGFGFTLLIARQHGGAQPRVEPARHPTPPNDHHGHSRT
jgi:hypothetical protein